MSRWVRSKALFLVAALVGAVLLSLMADPALAVPPGGGGLDKVASVLNVISTTLKTVIPAAAGLVLLGLGLSYAAGIIEKDTFIRWGIGVVIAGSASEITAMFISP